MSQEERRPGGGRRARSLPFDVERSARLRETWRATTRIAMAVALLVVATLVRGALDPLIGDQAPYLTYVAAVVVMTWLCGFTAGVVGSLIGAFVANYFFVQPRHQLIPHPDDWVAMTMFTVVCLGLVWLVARWRQAESVLRQQVDELQTIFDTVPAALFVTRDAKAETMTGNKLAAEYLRVPVGRNLSKTAPPDQRPTSFRVFKDGRELKGEELPVQMAIARGIEVRDYDFELVYGDETRRPLFGNVAPLRDRRGNIRGSVGAFIDVSERKRLENEVRQRVQQLERHVRELAESEARYRTMGETVPYGVWLTDARGGSLYVSDSFLELLDMTMAEQQQFGWTHRLVPEDVEPMMRKWMHCIETGELWDSEHRIIDRHGVVHTVLTRGLPVRDESGVITGWVGVNLDITERKAMEVKLREQAEELERANRLKDEFLATLSHELRTPLNAIAGWADMLRRGKLSGEAAVRAVESIHRNAQTQNQMINDVLDVSRIVSGQTRIDLQPLDPGIVLQHALESVGPTAQAKGIAVVTDVAEVPVPVAGDAGRLQQIFWNLMANAIKFTPSGGEIRVTLRYEDGAVRVEVADTGIGITREFLPHVFERFRQHDSSSTRQFGGLGLGLAIVRHLAELHGGTVTAESAGEGQGSKFTVRLPAQPMTDRRQGAVPAARTVPPVVPVPDDIPSVCGVRVLVVDDEPEALEVTAAVLRHHGATVAVAPSAARALAQLEEFGPAVLLIDLAMPAMDGYTLIRQIREADGKAALLPAIALTAFARDEDRRKALAAGFTLHLAKPVDAHVLLRAIANLGVASSPS